MAFDAFFKALKIIIVIFLSFLLIGLKNVYAEYYLVYSQADSCCTDAVRPVCIPHRSHCRTVHHYKPHHVCHHRPKNSCQISVYYYFPTGGVCNSSCGGDAYQTSCDSCGDPYPPPCGGRMVRDCHRFVDFSSQPYVYHENYNRYPPEYFPPEEYSYYDPDLSTGDDDVMTNPDMDIDE